MKHFSSILILLVLATTSFGYFDGIEDFGIFNGATGGGSPLYPSQEGLVQWLGEPTSSTNIEARVGVDGQVSAVHCLDFDGVDGYIEIDGTQYCTSYAEDFPYEFIAIPDNTTGTAHIYGATIESTDRCAIVYDYDNERFIFGHYDGIFRLNRTPAASALKGTTLTCKWEHGANGAYDRFYINGVEQALVDGTLSTTSAIGARIGGLQNGTSFFSGKLALVGRSDCAFYTLSNGSGTTAYDSSGNGNDGTHSGGVTHITADGLPSADLLNGFTIAGAVHIPADASDPTRDVLGDVLTNPGGYVNNGACSTITYGSITNTFSELVGHTNGVDNLWKKLDAAGFVTDTLTYTNGFTPGLWTIHDLWMDIPTSSDPSVELVYDTDGSLLIDSNGEVILALP